MIVTAFTITARFPLGVYQGHSSDGVTPDRFPSTSRLFSSMVHAASKGSMAEPQGADLRMSEASATALTWVENNPPKVWTPTGRIERFGHDVEIISYRPEALLEKGVPKKRAKRISQGVATESGWSWSWPDVPDDVATTLEAICADVACLGERESFAVLDTSREEAQGLSLSDKGQLDNNGIKVEAPVPGRLAELEAVHDKLLEAKPLTVAKDAASKKEDLQTTSVPRERVMNTFYTMTAAPEPDLPWTRAILIPINRHLPGDELVKWSVALHHTIARRIGFDAPAIVTGKYPRGFAPPSNRVAIQYLDPDLPTRVQLDGPSLALLIPHGMDAMDEWRLRSALGSSMRLVLGKSGTVELGEFEDISLEDFWAPVPNGHRRFWKTQPAAVPETGTQKIPGGKWTLGHSARLSVGFVFKDPSLQVQKGTTGYLELINQVLERGARVLSCQAIPDSRVERYAHRMPKHVQCIPYQALLDVGSLTTDSALVAIGQSRHLGGGLLVPVDLPEDLFGGEK